MSSSGLLGFMVHEKRSWKTMNRMAQRIYQMNIHSKALPNDPWLSGVNQKLWLSLVCSPRGLAGAPRLIDIREHLSGQRPRISPRTSSTFVTIVYPSDRLGSRVIDLRTTEGHSQAMGGPYYS